MSAIAQDHGRKGLQKCYSRSIMVALAMLSLAPARAATIIFNQLGQAGPSNFTILSLGGNIMFGSGDIEGNAGVLNTATYAGSGSTILTGELFLGSQSTYTLSGSSQVQGGIVKP